MHGKYPFKYGQRPKSKRQERQDNQEDVEVREKTDVGITRTEAEGVSGTQRQKKTHTVNEMSTFSKKESKTEK